MNTMTKFWTDMDYVADTIEVFGPFWPVIAFLMMIGLATLAIVMIVQTGRINREADRHLRNMK